MEKVEVKQEELILPNGTAAILIHPDGKAEMLLPKVNPVEEIPDNVYVAGLLFMAMHDKEVMEHVNNHFVKKDEEHNEKETESEAAA